MTTSTAPTCPRCSNPMHSNGSTPAGDTRWRCQNGGSYCYSTTNPDAKAKGIKKTSKKAKKFSRPLGQVSRGRYLITAAQNATPVHEGFWASLKVAAEHLGAEIIVIPIRYKNPTSRWTASQANEEWWCPEVEPYLFNARKKLCANLVLLGDIKVQPTASQPLTGLEGLTGGESAIVGHTKVALRVIPVPAGKTPKILTTTGACTLQNFTDSKAGQLGKFHHSLAATVVEVYGGRFHLRQISADKDGSFTDLDKSYSAQGVQNAPPALGLVMGDSHVRFIDKEVEEATFGPGGIVEILNPGTLVWHDALDGFSVNPHHEKNPFAAYAKHQSGYSNVRDEVEDTIEFLDEHTVGRKSVIVPSNHDCFLSRYVISSDWKTDPENSKFYLETALAMIESTKIGPGGTEYADPFIHWVSRLSTNPDVRCLKSDESFTLAGIECGIHGHQGPNGSRGSAKNLSRLGARTIIGHSHTPCIQEGCFQAGTSTPLKLEYTKGPSSWLNSHVVIYASGKRSLITIIAGEWKLPD